MEVVKVNLNKNIGRKNIKSWICLMLMLACSGCFNSQRTDCYTNDVDTSVCLFYVLGAATSNKFTEEQRTAAFQIAILQCIVEEQARKNCDSKSNIVPVIL